MPPPRVLDKDTYLDITRVKFITRWTAGINKSRLGGKSKRRRHNSKAQQWAVQYGMYKQDKHVICDKLRILHLANSHLNFGEH